MAIIMEEQTSAVKAPAKDKLRIGIIGCGGIANNKHMPSLKKIENVEMVAFCDVIIERAEKPQRNTARPALRFTRITDSCLKTRA